MCLLAFAVAFACESLVLFVFSLDLPCFCLFVLPCLCLYACSGLLALAYCFAYACLLPGFVFACFSFAFVFVFACVCLLFSLVY